MKVTLVKDGNSVLSLSGLVLNLAKIDATLAGTSYNLYCFGKLAKGSHLRILDGTYAANHHNFDAGSHGNGIVIDLEKGMFEAGVSDGVSGTISLGKSDGAENLTVNIDAAKANDADVDGAFFFNKENTISVYKGVTFRIDVSGINLGPNETKVIPLAEAKTIAWNTPYATKYNQMVGTNAVKYIARYQLDNSTRISGGKRVLMTIAERAEVAFRPVVMPHTHVASVKIDGVAYEGIPTMVKEGQLVEVTFAADADHSLPAGETGVRKAYVTQDAFAVEGPMPSVEYTWIGGESGDWRDPSNWSGAPAGVLGYPNGADYATAKFPSTLAAATINLGSSDFGDDLAVKGLSLDAVGCELTVTNGTLKIPGKCIGSGKKIVAVNAWITSTGTQLVADNSDNAGFDLYDGAALSGGYTGPNTAGKTTFVHSISGDNGILGTVYINGSTVELSAANGELWLGNNIYAKQSTSPIVLKIEEGGEISFNNITRDSSKKLNVTFDIAVPTNGFAKAPITSRTAINYNTQSWIRPSLKLRFPVDFKGGKHIPLIGGITNIGSATLYENSVVEPAWMKPYISLYYEGGVLYSDVSYGPVVVGDCTWKYGISDGSAFVIGVLSATGDLEIPSVLVGLPVTGIGDYAFDCCSALTSVTIPSSVTSIGSYAFRGCNALSSVYVDSEAEIGRVRGMYNWPTGVEFVVRPFTSVDALVEQGFPDECGLVAELDSPDKLAQFNAWAIENGITGSTFATPAAKSAAHVTYALSRSGVTSSPHIFTAAPEIVFESVEPKTDGAAAGVSVRVSVKDGAARIPVVAAELAGRVRKSMSLSSWQPCDAGDVTVSAANPDGSVELTIVPPGTDGGFLKLDFGE